MQCCNQCNDTFHQCLKAYNILIELILEVLTDLKRIRILWLNVFFLWMISNIRIAIGSYINVQILEMILIIIGLVWDKIKSETIRAPTQKSDMNREVHLTFNGPGKQKCVQYRFKRSPGICCCCLSSKSNVKRRVTSKYTKF